MKYACGTVIVERKSRKREIMFALGGGGSGGFCGLDEERVGEEAVLPYARKRTRNAGREWMRRTLGDTLSSLEGDWCKRGISSAVLRLTYSC